MKSDNLKLKAFLTFSFGFSLSALLFSLSHASTLENRMQQVEVTYQRTRSLQAEFIQTTRVEILDKTVRRTGRIFYEKGGRLRIEYGGNPMTHYIIDGKNLWIWHPKEKQLDTYSLSATGLPEEALKFLTGLGQLRAHFTVKEGAGEAVILKPKKKSSYHSLTCRFDEKHYLSEMTIHNKNGNESTYLFFNRQSNHPLPPNLFKRP